jgi:hypothetical protein
MTTRLLHCASLFIATLILAVTVVSAQTPGTQTSNLQTAANIKGSGQSEFRLTEWLAQARPQKPARFSLLPTSTVEPTASGPLVPLVVLGGGSVGKLAKWTGFTLVNSFIGDSSIFEDSSGKVGIGTVTPASPLTVAGMIESRSSGFKFPDGTVQATAAVSGLQAVVHDATLAGNGTAASPLSVVQSGSASQIEPVGAKIDVNMPDGGAGQGGIIYTVPAGKRLVIEQVSAIFLLPIGQKAATLSIETSPQAGGDKIPHQMSWFFAGDQGAFAAFHSGQLMKLYAAPNTVVVVNANRDSFTGDASCTFYISGYLVNLP